MIMPVDPIISSYESPPWGLARRNFRRSIFILPVALEKK